MNTLQIISIAVSLLGTVITTVLAWVVIYRVNKVQVSFSGEPVDRKDFERSMAANDAAHAQLFSKLGGVERGAAAAIREYEASANESRRLMHQEIDSIGKDVAALKREAQLANQQTVLLNAKLDRLIERNIA